jgi:16S rRNA (uracil1498-N3)-methyltransferase
MRRIVISRSALENERVILRDPGLLHHLRRVLRVNQGDALECVDEQGRIYRGTILKSDSHQLILGVAAQEPGRAARGSAVSLAAALVKTARYEWLVEKATELGMAALLPLITQRTTVRPAPERAQHQVARWRRIAQAAVQQCGGVLVPRIEPPQSFEALARQLGRYGAVLMPTLITPVMPWSEVASQVAAAKDVLIMIGPEGDFTEAEVRAAVSQGARPISLGPEVLRSETAALNALSIARYLRGA